VIRHARGQSHGTQEKVSLVGEEAPRRTSEAEFRLAIGVASQNPRTIGEKLVDGFPWTRTELRPHGVPVDARVLNHEVVTGMHHGNLCVELLQHEVPSVVRVEDHERVSARLGEHTLDGAHYVRCGAVAVGKLDTGMLAQPVPIRIDIDVHNLAPRAAHGNPVRKVERGSTVPRAGSDDPLDVEVVVDFR
jgi:hypothetical protein